MSEDVSSLTVGVPRETFPGERRVALVPANLKALVKAGAAVSIESGAGEAAGFTDEEYRSEGATVVNDRPGVFASSNVILQVRACGANPEAGPNDLSLLREGQTLIAGCDPLSEPALFSAVAERGVTCFALELLPRITRAQSMDVLSSMATISGYKAVLLAASALPRMFPMMMTAAGTITPARVFVVGAGVAGLQAIATARRLGAVVEAYDVRPDVKEQVESLGGKFVEMELDSAEGEGGYAKAMDEAFYRRQRELMARVVARNDVVITTAAIPGRKAPILVTAEMLTEMAPGSVVVDLAAERGGNCEGTQAGETITSKAVTIIGPVNLPSTVPYHASEMYAKNISTFLLNLIHDGQVDPDRDDEIIRQTLVTRGGEIVNERILGLLGQNAAEDRTDDGSADSDSETESFPGGPPADSTEVSPAEEAGRETTGSDAGN